METTEEREARISLIKEQITNGSYNVNAKLVYLFLEVLEENVNNSFSARR